MNNPDKSSNSEKGVALISVLLFMMALGVLSTALVVTAQNGIKTSAAYKYNQQAQYVANAGVQQAVSWFDYIYTPHSQHTDYDLTLSSSPYPQYATHDVALSGDATGSSNFPESARITDFYSQFSATPLQASTSNAGAYTVNATLLKHKATTFIGTDFIDVSSALERWEISSTGQWGTAARSLGTAQITATIENSGNALFDRAIWGIDKVTLGGTTRVDSYDPTKGIWDSLSNNGYLGSVGSNGSIDASGTTTLHGDLGYGKDPNDTYSLGNNVDFDPSINKITKLKADRAFPPIPSFSTKYNNTSTTIGPHASVNYTPYPTTYGDISLKGTMTLGPGVYYFKSLDAQSGATINISNATTIFVETDFNLHAQGIINNTSLDPTKLSVFYRGINKSTINGGTNAYLEMYAPNADVEIDGHAALNGSVIGKTVKSIGTADIHFSESCLSSHLIPQPFRIITWSQDAFH